MALIIAFELGIGVGIALDRNWRFLWDLRKPVWRWIWKRLGRTVVRFGDEE